MRAIENLMRDFLKDNYLSLNALSKKHNISEQIILLLENSQCIPGHTYEHRQTNMFTCAGVTSALDEHLSHSTTLYYHVSVSNWIKDALFELKTTDLETLSQRVKRRFSQQLHDALNGIKTPGCQSFAQAWTYWIDGTWGKCLKHITAKCLAQKELSRRCIAECMTCSPSEINIAIKDKLTKAVNNYINASLL